MSYLMSALEQLRTFIADFAVHIIAAQAEDPSLFGVEGLYSQRFSVGIFYFLLFSILLFTAIVFAFMFSGKTKLKRGEKLLFAWIFLGIIVAIIFGASQMLNGFLF